MIYEAVSPEKFRNIFFRRVAIENFGLIGGITAISVEP